MGSRRAQIEAELRQAINPEPLARQLRQALNVIARGSRYLGSAAHAMLVGELAKGIVNLGKVSSQLLRETNLMTTLGLDSDNMEAIAHLGAATYDEGLYPDCQALYVLLSTLHPENHDYWYRLGIAAQQNEQFELALRAYAASILLDPDSPAAHLFSAQCYLELGMKGDAQVEFLEAKRLAESLPEDSEMQHLVASLATLLQAEEQQGGE
jgi:tetratricopeptide (TPR) repeat protein